MVFLVVLGGNTLNWNHSDMSVALLVAGILTIFGGSFPIMVPAVVVFIHFFPDQFDHLRQVISNNGETARKLLIIVAMLAFLFFFNSSDDRPSRGREFQQSDSHNEPSVDSSNAYADFSLTAVLMLLTFFLPRIWAKLYLFITGWVPEAYRESWRSWTLMLQPPSLPIGSMPTSREALDQLESVVIEEKHLLMENSPGGIVCPICLDTMGIGSSVTRLPCKHFYHKACLTPWLNNHNSCPTCRYELKTDNVEYEFHRVQREQTRVQTERTSPTRPRRSSSYNSTDSHRELEARRQERMSARYHRLMTLSVVELKALARQKNVNIIGCVEKHELVERVVRYVE